MLRKGINTFASISRYRHINVDWGFEFNRFNSFMCSTYSTCFMCSTYSTFFKCSTYSTFFKFSTYSTFFKCSTYSTFIQVFNSLRLFRNVFILMSKFQTFRRYWQVYRLSIVTCFTLFRSLWLSYCLTMHEYNSCFNSEAPTSMIIALTGVLNLLLIPPIEEGKTPQSAVH